MWQKIYSQFEKSSTPLIIMALVTLVTIGSLLVEFEPDTLELIQRSNTLRVVTRNGPTTYYQDQAQSHGFEYDLARAFADDLGVKLEIVSSDRLDTIFQMLETRQAHLAAAGLSITPERQQRVAFSQAIHPIQQLVVYRAGELRPRDDSDLLGRSLVAISNSAHVETLQQLQSEYPDLQWQEVDDAESIDLLELVRDGKFDLAIIDSNEFAVNRSLFPTLREGFQLGDPQELAWAMRLADGDSEFAERVEQFLTKMHENGELDNLIARYFNGGSKLDAGGATTFARRVEKVLPRYIELIQRVANEENFDWRLLAAIAYQESHWNPRALSPTGVRGFMMLTQITAREMGVKNRLDPEQSLRGGARYFTKTKSRIPERISEPDRTYLALAAYNIGFGHLEDARIITQRQGKNPDTWEDVRQHLPLLQKRRWYKTTKHGYARGQEPVNYVKNIRHFADYLRWHDIISQRDNDPVQAPDEALDADNESLLDALNSNLLGL